MLDATNSTETRRQYLRTRFHGKWQYLYIESICNDMEVRAVLHCTAAVALLYCQLLSDDDANTQHSSCTRHSYCFFAILSEKQELCVPCCAWLQVLEHNYRLKMMYSPDYKGVDTEQALAVRNRRGGWPGCASVLAVMTGRLAGWLAGHACPQISPAPHSLSHPSSHALPPAGPPPGLLCLLCLLCLPTRPPAVPAASAMQDFRARIRKYEEGYETIMDRTLHYIKLIDMVTGGWVLPERALRGLAGCLLVRVLHAPWAACVPAPGQPASCWVLTGASVHLQGAGTWM